MTHRITRIRLSNPFTFLLMLPVLTYGGVVVLLSPHISHAAGTTYYVATSGDDSNLCSQSSPCRTIAHGASILQPGDTLIVRAGTYQEFITTEIPNGTSSSPITIKANPGDTV